MTIKAWWANSPDLVIQEVAWEKEMHNAGAEAFERSLSRNGRATAPSQTPMGMREIQKMLPKALAGVKEIQKDTVTGAARMPREIRGGLLLGDPYSMSIMTLSRILDHCVASHTHSYPLSNMSHEIGRAVEMEVNFQNWITKSRAAAREYAKEHDLPKPPKSIAERLLREYGNSERNILRWRGIFDDLTEYTWCRQTLMFIGEALISGVVRKLPDDFSINLRYLNKDKRVKEVTASEALISRFDQRTRNIAYNQVVRKPMLTRPKPWTAEEE